MPRPVFVRRRGATGGPPAAPTYAAHFVGASSQYANLASNSDFQVAAGQDLAIAGWVRLNGAGAHANERVFGKWGTNPAIEYLIYMNGSGNLLNFIVFTTSSGFVTASPTTSVTTDTWHFFYAQWDHTAGAISLTVDNDTAHTVTVTGIPGINTSASDVDFATDSVLTAGDFLNGDVGPLGVWKRLLTTQEQGTLYNGGKNNYTLAQLSSGFQTSLKGWYDMGNNFNDASGNAHHFTAHNSPTFVARP